MDNLGNTVSYSTAGRALQQSLPAGAAARPAGSSGASNYYLNAHGAQEKYLVSGNGSNAAAGGYYILMPNGNLYAWTGNSLASSLAATPAAQLGTTVYANPTLLINAAAPFNATALSIEQSLDLEAPPGTADYYFNTHGGQEKYLLSGAAAGGYYIILPDGNLYAWIDNSLSSSLMAAPVATLPTFDYQNPAYLIDATTASSATAVSANIASGILTVSDSANFEGQAAVYVTASTSASTTIETFFVTFAGETPVLAADQQPDAALRSAIRDDAGRIGHQRHDADAVGPGRGLQSPLHAGTAA